MPDGLYDRDVLLWSEEQAMLLRRLATGERLNDTVDWPNLIEEVESLGRAELKSCESLLRLAILHALKLHAWPNSQAVAHWRMEVFTFATDAQDVFTPSMRQRIDLQSLYANACKRLALASDESGAHRPTPDQCPLVLDDLLDPSLDPTTLVAKFLVEP